MPGPIEAYDPPPQPSLGAGAMPSPSAIPFYQDPRLQLLALVVLALVAGAVILLILFRRKRSGAPPGI